VVVAVAGHTLGVALISGMTIAGRFIRGAAIANAETATNISNGITLTGSNHFIFVDAFIVLIFTDVTISSICFKTQQYW
jgi:hypothetical protein